MDGRKWERGSALAWTAAVLAFVVLPLIALLLDGARLFYADTRLEDATSAACEALAQASIYEQVRQFQQTGKLEPKVTYTSRRAAVAVFTQDLQGDPVLQLAHTTLRISTVNGLPQCAATSTVKAMFMPYTSHLHAVAVPSARGSRR
ncbi:MAG TPA: hypothetical protein ENJ54_00125 [Chloroflexi bacterium]|nr:hypothetical protein [Chloroflexota bacterium]